MSEYAISTLLGSPSLDFMYISASAPEAPPLSETTIGCFIRLFLWIAACILRAIWSEAPPAPAATTISTGLVGSQPATAGAAQSAAVSAIAAFIPCPTRIVPNSCLCSCSNWQFAKAKGGLHCAGERRPVQAAQRRTAYDFGMRLIASAAGPQTRAVSAPSPTMVERHHAEDEKLCLPSWAIVATHAFAYAPQGLEPRYLPFQFGVRLLRKASMPSRKSSLI